MTALAKKDIVEVLTHEDINERLFITPLLDVGNVIGTCSVDLRLGNQFYLLKQGAVSHLNPKDTNTDIHKIAQRVVVPYGHPFVVHPNQFILGSTLEYLRLPNNLMAYVTSRSRWGRMGLITATATKIDPGFTGCITLEIVNE